MLSTKISVFYQFYNYILYTKINSVCMYVCCVRAKSKLNTLIFSIEHS